MFSLHCGLALQSVTVLCLAILLRHNYREDHVPGKIFKKDHYELFKRHTGSLDELVTSAPFQRILKEELTTHRLIHVDIAHSLDVAYHKVSKICA